ncbi:antibiotic biosynthesis monooxygenase [Ruegeria sp. 2205SS24-7]|uniref:antibiotic biosynthesis monooxygenase n=1 Tax=Ruegeria discodermiae TaxID=3064389 RepID=UPI0027421C2D|nr:antibiotic biosynthesis monooxygenase [Ruegeria sp. 2205SS24-7]MDP5216640.1 antibiotic biosynthesis monooxygenase [Ruegeria sp. 2205SS24-7]
MIIRIFRAIIYEERVDELRTFLTQTALPLMREQTGLVSITAGLPRPESPNEFCLVMVWDSVASLAAFAGEDWQKPHIMPEEEGIVRDRFLHHFDMA